MCWTFQSWVSATVFFSILVDIRSKPSKGSSTGGSKACAHTGFYSKKVVPLCETHFPDETSKNAWVVQFYHPYVQKVFDAKEAFEQLASNPQKIGGAKVGAVDCQNNGEFCAKHGIQTAPTTRVMLHSSSRGYEGEHTLDALQAFVLDSMKRFKDTEEALQCNVKGVFPDPKKDATWPLCTSKFPPSLETTPWMISFYEAGDRNKDKTMRSVMNKIAEKYGNHPPKKVDAKKKKPLKMRVGSVECHAQAEGCKKFGISSFPAVRFYRYGADPIEFDSFFDKDELVQWADTQLANMPKPKVAEMLQADMPQSGDAKQSGDAQSSSDGEL